MLLSVCDSGLAAQAHYFLGQALVELGEAKLGSAVHHLSKARPRPTQLQSCESRTAAECTSLAWQQFTFSLRKVQSV